MFDWKKPTVQMLGRWQPWHEGHQALFKRCVAKTGQVAIQVRDVQGASGGDGQDDNPFDWDTVCKNIEEGLAKRWIRERCRLRNNACAKRCKYYIWKRRWLQI